MRVNDVILLRGAKGAAGALGGVILGQPIWPLLGRRLAP